MLLPKDPHLLACAVIASVGPPSAMSSTLRVVAQHAPDYIRASRSSSRSTVAHPGSLADILHNPYFELVLTTVLPAVAILLALSADVLSRLPYPLSTHRCVSNRLSPAPAPKPPALEKSLNQNPTTTIK